MFRASFIVSLATVLAAFLALLSGCNRVRGAAEDVSMEAPPPSINSGPPDEAAPSRPPRPRPPNYGTAGPPLDGAPNRPPPPPPPPEPERCCGDDDGNSEAAPSARPHPGAGRVSAPRRAAVTRETHETALDEPYCDVLGDRVTVGECTYFREIMASLASGSAGLRLPPRIVRGEPATVSFAVTRDADAAPVPELLGAQPTREFELKVGRRMAAMLQGDGFKIEPGGLQHRDLFVGNGARWDWKVTATRAPIHRLVLSAYVAVPSSNGTKETLLKSKEYPVNVMVTPGQRVGDALDDSSAWLTKGENWLKALLGFLLAGAAVFAIFRPKRAQPARP